MSENVFRILEIEPTTDKKEIKRAYAGLVKRYHPEEFPEEWEKIHDAYEQALKIAEYGKPPMSAEPPEPSVQEEEPEAEPLVQEEEPVVELSVQEEEPETEPPELIDEEKAPEKSGEMEALFDNIGEMARERQQNSEYYAEKKIYEAYARESASGSGDDAGTRRRKIRRTVWIIMIVVGAILRFWAGYTRNAREAQRFNDIPITAIPITTIPNTAADNIAENAGNDTGENTIADSTAENAGNDIVQNLIPNNLVEIDGNTVRTRIPLVPDKIRIGDSREVMIEALGEPEEIRGLQENPDKEEAVYSSFEFGDSLIVVLENDVITDLYVEYTMEEAASGTYPVMDSK